MESQPQNPEFRINPENFHPSLHDISNMRFPTIWHFDMNRFKPACAAPFKLRNSRCCYVSSLTVIENTQVTSKGSDQTAHMRRLI